jgi:hypothetical protein
VIERVCSMGCPRPSTSGAKRANHHCRPRGRRPRDDRHQPFERFEWIERAYTAALAGRDPERVSIIDLLPEIFAAVPDTSTEEIAEALRWSARKNLREADALEQWRTRRRDLDDPGAA